MGTRRPRKKWAVKLSSFVDWYDGCYSYGTSRERNDGAGDFASFTIKLIMKMTQTQSVARAGLGRWPFLFHVQVFIIAVAVCVFAGIHPAAAQPTVIGSSANLSLPPSAAWNEIVNILPGSNSTVTINPPLFSWFASPGTPLNEAVDQNLYLYRFQADYNGTFANPVVDVSTPSCCYNFLAPFTSSPVYWRVAYVTTNGVTNSWITNMFYIAGNATNWDRSMFANPSYLASKGAHPHLFFNSGNQAALYQYLRTSMPTYWQTASNTAVQGMNSAYWTNPVPWGNNPYSLNPGIDTMALQISSAALVWQLTGNPAFTNLIATNYDNLVNCFVAAGQAGIASGYDTDYGDSGGDNLWIKAIACGYDWLYPILTPAERTNALGAMDRVLRLGLYNGFWVTPKNNAISSFPSGNVDVTSTYPPPYLVPYAAMTKLSAAHAFMCFEQTWIAALACFADNYQSPAWPVFLTNYPSDAALELDLGLNYSLGRGVPMGLIPDSGRCYGFEDVLDNAWLANDIDAAIVFPEANLGMDPRLNQMAAWWMGVLPPGYESVHEQWGDIGHASSGLMAKPISGRDLALLSGNQAVAGYLQALNQVYGTSGAGIYFDELMQPFYFPMPTAGLAPSAGCLPDDGWAWGSTYPPSSPSCMGNGVGFIFAARPKGSAGGVGHAQFNDLNLEIWGYGANITDGAGGSSTASKLSWSYNTCQIDGLGQAQSAEGPIVPAVGQIIAYTNAPDYVYVAGDATYAYPHTPFPFAGDPGGWLVPATYANQLSTGPLSYVTKVQRHVLFEHHQYFVVYDDLATSKPANFEWVYHVYHDTVQMGNGGSFNYTANPAMTYAHLPAYNWSNAVTVSVFQVVNPALLGAVQLNGSQAYLNPITGENEFAGAMYDMTNGTGMPLMTNSIWVTNIVPTNQFHFMTVIFPVAPGSNAPSMGRLDDYTVAVTNGSQVDIISFDPNTKQPYTLLVNSPYVTTGATPLPTPPTPLYTNSSAQVVKNPTGPTIPPPTAPLYAWVISNQSPSTFTPPPGYLAWWNSDTLTGSNGSKVASWVDSSSNAINLTQNFSGAQPVLEVSMKNGRNCLLFNGSSSYMTENTTGNVSQPLEIFTVALPATTSFNGMVNGNSAGSPFGYGIFNGAYGLLAGDGLGGGTAAANWSVLTGVYNGSTSTAYVNGNQVITPAYAGGETMGGFCLGAMFNGSPEYFWNGYIGDVIIYTNILSTANQQAVEAGLRAKYGF